MVNYLIKPTITDFGLVDERGRKVGIMTWALVMTTRWDCNLVRPDSMRGGIVACDPYVLVGSHVTRNGEQYGALVSDKAVGLVADPATQGAAERETERRIKNARKRCEKKYKSKQS